MDRVYLCSVSREDILCIDLRSILDEEDYCYVKYVDITHIEEIYSIVKRFVESYKYDIVNKFRRNYMDHEDRGDYITLSQLYVLLRAWFELVEPVLDLDRIERIILLMYVLLKHVHNGEIRMIGEEDLKNLKNVKVLTVVGFK